MEYAEHMWRETVVGPFTLRVRVLLIRSRIIINGIGSQPSELDSPSFYEIINSEKGDQLGTT